MYNNLLFVDVEIGAEGDSIRAHKVVLAAASSTLKAILTSEMIEAKTSKISIKASIPSVKVFVKYMYTYSASVLNGVSPFVLADLHHLSKYYAVNSLTEECLRRMEHEYLFLDYFNGFWSRLRLVAVGAAAEGALFGTATRRG
jgi:hypothetical protein